MLREDVLKKFDFGNEAGDDISPSELSQYFVEQELTKDLLDHQAKLLVATGKKGIGKSALIQWLAHRLPKIRSDLLIVKCRGAELSGLKTSTPDPSEPNDYIKDWMSRICTLVNRELAKDIGLALSDDKITLVEAAEIEGYKQRNLVRSLLDRFRNAVPRLNAEPQLIANEIEMLKRAKARPVWILIDDLDATFQNTEKERIALSTFFTACRYLCRDLESLTIRVTMRTDVWPVIRRQDEALDKMDQYIRELKWSEVEYRKLLARRVAYEFKRLRIPNPPPPAHVHFLDRELNLIQKVFVPTVPWGGENREVDTYKVIYTLSYGRPRWAIQLCKLAQKDAVTKRQQMINKENIDNVWGTYGAKRISDIVAEHKHQAPQVEELINAFRGAPRVFSRDELLLWINNKVLTHLAPFIDGKKANGNREIAHFLYRVGFLQARSQESGGAYEHYDFDVMPDFLTSRTNDDFSVLWEIHPSYRESLDIEKLNRSQRIRKGLIRTRPTE